MKTESVPVAVDIPPPAKRRRWLTIVLALAIFAAGFATGAGVTALAAVNRIQYAIQHPELAPARVAKMLQRRLRLDDDQRAKVERIIAERQTRLATIRRQFQPLITLQLNQLRDEIGEVLNTDQRERWNTLFNTLVERWLPPAPPAETAEST